VYVTQVTDPSKYGVVVTDESGKVERFVEKPKKFVGDNINAGIYCLNPRCGHLYLTPLMVTYKTQDKAQDVIDTLPCY